MNINSIIKDRFLDLYSFERLNEFKKIAKYENSSVDDVKKKFKTINGYLSYKLGNNISIDIVKELFERTKEEREYINRVYRKCTQEREKGFGGFRAFFDWYDAQEQKCDYCETSQKDLTGIFERGVISSKKFSPTLQIERKNSSAEYSKDNCILACSLCNNAKSDLINEEDFRKYFSRPMKEYLSDKTK